MDLSLIPIEDIHKELKRRYDAYVFAGSRNLSKDEGDCEVMVCGGIVSELGLSAVIEKRLHFEAMQYVIDERGDTPPPS